jgi:hypothetical protein
MEIYRNFLKIGCLVFILQLFTSCSDILDTTSRNILTDDTVWGNNDGITAYIANMYNTIQVEDLTYTSYEQGTYMAQVTDEATRSYTWGVVNNNPLPDGLFEWWGYDNIRTANYFLQKIETATISEDLKAKYKAETRFIRAFHYFNLAKRYGGVPIITVPQQFTGDNVSELQVPRNTEKEVYEFIRTELDAIIESGLPESWEASGEYRATKYVALALKSRAMLYAASIATYGEVQIDGLVGIPAADKGFYWTEAMNAAAAIIDSKKYSLYRVDADKAVNFQNMFLVKELHSESIYTKAYAYPNKGHSFDFFNAPESFKSSDGYGCITNPTLQMVEEFGYVDGSSGELKITDTNGNPVKYANPYDLFKNKDPRLFASVMLPFSPWKGGIIEIRRGIILPNGDKLTASKMSDMYGVGDNAIKITGKDGPFSIGDPTKTGFYVKKFQNPTDPVIYGRGTTYGMVFRYAEILLNYAEAAVELGKNTDKALAYINDIRDRAGVKTYNDIDLSKVRKERKLELAFENHRWWDIIRWRVATTLLDGVKVKALHPYLVWEEGKKPSEMSYIFEIADNVKPNPKIFMEKYYYRNIPSAQRATNPNLKPNPLY